MNPDQNDLPQQILNAKPQVTPLDQDMPMNLQSPGTIAQPIQPENLLPQANALNYTQPAAPLVGQASPTYQQPYSQPQKHQSGAKKVLKIIGIGCLGFIVVYILWVIVFFAKDILFGTGHKSVPVSNVSSNSTQFVDKKDGFSITQPAGWGTSAPTSQAVIATFQDPQADIAGAGAIVHPGIVISKASVGANATLANLVPAVMAGFARQQGYSQISSIPQTISGLPAQLVTFTFSLQNQYPVTADELIVIKDGVGYTAQSLSLSSAWPQHKDVIEKSVLSFQLL